MGDNYINVISPSAFSGGVSICRTINLHVIWPSLNASRRVDTCVRSVLVRITQHRPVSRTAAGPTSRVSRLVAFRPIQPPRHRCVVLRDSPGRSSLSATPSIASRAAEKSSTVG